MSYKKYNRFLTLLLATAITCLYFAGSTAIACQLPTFDEPAEQLYGDVDAVASDLGWWAPRVAQAMRNTSSPQPITLDEVLVRTLIHSNQIKVFADLPMIRRTAITEADSAFDWSRFLETRWDDLNDPVGNSLTVGGTGTRFVNQQWTAGAGLRRRNRNGGEFDVRQNIGWQETNSNFFVPNPQGTARLVLGYTQPLLRGRGRIYNESLICLAQLDVNIANDEFRRQLQSHLLEVTRAYWSLYLERGVLFQKMNSHQRARDIYEKLARRAAVDAQQTQIISAQASVTTRYAELIRARMAVKNAESRLRALVNDPEFGEFDEVEIIPIDAPQTALFEAEMRESMDFAIKNRPEVLQALKQIKAGQLRSGMSRHELLPQLDLITQAYVAGLEGAGSISDAYSEQFTAGRPSYSVGVNYGIPIGNRAANARLQRRQLELRQLQNQYQTTLQTVKLEVEIAVREIQTASQEMEAKRQAMDARGAQLDSLTKRWQRLPGEDVSAALALENLLVSQERLADAEFEYLSSQLTYNLAQMNLKRATGLLLQAEGIAVGETCAGGLPTHVITKEGVAIDAMAVPNMSEVDRANATKPAAAMAPPTTNPNELRETGPVLQTVNRIDPPRSEVRTAARRATKATSVPVPQSGVNKYLLREPFAGETIER